MPPLRLDSERLLLRPPQEADSPAIVSLIAEWDIVKNLSRAPYPYREEDAREAFARHQEGRARGTDFTFTLVRKSDGALIGKCGLHLQQSGFEMGYWLGRPYWKQGYATEAAARVLAFGFGELKADRIRAGWFHDNPASGRVLKKLGFVPDGADQHDCLARGHSVYCNLMTLSREDFARRCAA